MLSDPKPGHWRLRALEFECSSVVTHFCRLMLHRKCTCPTFLPFNTIDLVISPCLMDIWLAARQSPLSSPSFSASLHLSFLCWWGGEEETTTTKKPKRQPGLESKELTNEENRCFPDVACGCRRDPRAGWVTHWLLCSPPPPQQPSSSPRPCFCLSTAGLWSQDTTQEARSCNRFFFLY